MSLWAVVEVSDGCWGAHESPLQSTTSFVLVFRTLRWTGSWSCQWSVSWRRCSEILTFCLRREKLLPTSSGIHFSPLHSVSLISVVLYFAVLSLCPVWILPFCSSALSQDEQDDAQLRIEDILQMVRKRQDVFGFFTSFERSCLNNNISLFLTVFVSLCVSRRTVQRQSVLSLSQRWSWLSRSLCWTTSSSGAFLMSQSSYTAVIHTRQNKTKSPSWLLFETALLSSAVP